MILAPSQGSRDYATVAQGVGIADRRGGPVLAFLRIELFRAGQITIGRLRAPLGRGIPAQPAGIRIQMGRTDFPAVLTGLAAVEPGSLQLPLSAADAQRGDPEGNMGRVHPVVGDGGRRIVHGGSPVHERGGTQGRLAGRGQIERKCGVRVDRMAVPGRELHKKVMGMLAVDEGLALVGFAGLEEQRIAALGHGPGLQAEHPAKREFVLRPLPCGHEHEPVRGIDLMAAARTQLVVEGKEGVVMGHDHPPRLHVVDGVHRRGIRLPGSARRVPLLGDPGEKKHRGHAHARHGGHGVLGPTDGGKRKGGKGKTRQEEGKVRVFSFGDIHVNRPAILPPAVAGCKSNR